MSLSYRDVRISWLCIHLYENFMQYCKMLRLPCDLWLVTYVYVLWTLTFIEEISANIYISKVIQVLLWYLQYWIALPSVSLILALLLSRKKMLFSTELFHCSICGFFQRLGNAYCSDFTSDESLLYSSNPMIMCHITYVNLWEWLWWI